MNRTGSILLASLLFLAAIPVAAALSAGARAPEIGLRDLQGHTVRLADLRDKIVFVDFWASWCGPCREEMPVLERLHRQYKDQGLVVVGVSVDRDIAAVRRFLARTPVTFPVVHDAEQAVAGRYGPARMPSSYIIKNGVVRHVHSGFGDEDAAVFEREIRALLPARH